MRAGSLIHRVELREQQRVPDGMGGHSESWVSAGQVWADVVAPTGRMAVVAQQLEALVSLEVRVREGVSVRDGMRVIHDGVAYRIEAVLPDYRARMQRLLCAKVVPQ